MAGRVLRDFEICIEKQRSCFFFDCVFFKKQPNFSIWKFFLFFELTDSFSDSFWLWRLSEWSAALAAP